jgi:hypothetical protein
VLRASESSSIPSSIRFQADYRQLVRLLLISALGHSLRDGIALLVSGESQPSCGTADTLNRTNPMLVGLSCSGTIMSRANAVRHRRQPKAPSPDCEERMRAVIRVPPHGRGELGGLVHPKSDSVTGGYPVRPPRCERGSDYRPVWFSVARQQLNGICRTLNQAFHGPLSSEDGSPHGSRDFAEAM